MIRVILDESKLFPFTHLTYEEVNRALREQVPYICTPQTCAFQTQYVKAGYLVVACTTKGSICLNELIDGGVVTWRQNAEQLLKCGYLGLIVPSTPDPSFS